MKKYWYLVVLPAALFALGAICNQIAVKANHNQMPVSWPGGCSAYPDPDNDPEVRPDPVHKCMTKDSHVKILSDWIESDAGISSIGDYMMDAAQVFFGPFLVLWCFLTGIHFLKQPLKHGKDDSTL